MSAEETLIETRKAKHQELNGGTYPLAEEVIYYCLGGLIQYMAANPQPVSLDPTQLHQVRYVHGRISNLRKSGGITFIKLTDRTGSMQVIATKASLADYDKLRLLDLGDIIEIKGYLCVSKTNENSILIETWKVLTKSHRPPPEKFVGIADQELKYRKRYLDLMSSEESRARFVVRTHIIRAIRKFMEERNFMEVETSTLCSLASGANALPFTTHHNALDMEMYLRIAPELYLKRLLVGGYEKVYEIGRNYRNEGISTRHNPEFTMMEYYEAYGRFPDLIVQTKSLLRDVRDHLRNNLPPNIAPFYQKWEAEHPFSLSQFVETPMWDAVVHACATAEIMPGAYIHPLIRYPGTSSMGADIEIVNPENERLKKIDIKGLFHALSNCTSNGEKIYALFEYVAEPFLTEDYRSGDGKHSCPVFITQYPKDVSPLARTFDKCDTLCERFELFIEGRELANAFQELNDPDEQALRFQEQLEMNDKDPMAYDADYVEALEYGMPPAIGFGMGIDRLVMLLTNAESIKDVILFPTLKPLR